MTRKLTLVLVVLAVLLVLLIAAFQGCRSTPSGRIEWRGLDSGYRSTAETQRP